MRVGLQELAGLLAASPRHVAELAARGIIPRQARGKYTVAEAVPAYIRHLRQAYERRAEKIGEAEAAARLLAARAQLAEDRLRQARGTLMPAAAVIPFIERMFMSVKDNMLALPGKCAVRLAACTTAVEVQDVLTNAVHEVLQRASETKLDLSDLKQIHPDVPAPPPPAAPKRRGKK